MIIAIKKRVQAKPALTAIVLAVVGAVLVLGLSFLWQQRHKTDNAGAFDAVQALKNFDPGNIMSDAVMANKNSMSQSQIQNFLNSKNRCKTNPQSPSVLTSINKAKTEGTYKYGGTTYKYHLNNGKFICLADQKFDGETAAKIIYSAAQSYSINPQVLLVFLEKEQGLISDNWPNYNFQYATAMGFGCPDSGPNNSANCNSKYFGFKNQIRQAAELLREVLDGGWTNYPLGNNNILYNPDPSCGTQKVNIKNLATSALYRYTPYVPNKGALAAGYGTAKCGAYGNRNFFLFFTNWFGDASKGGSIVNFTSMKKPRNLQAKKDVEKLSMNTLKGTGSVIQENQIFYYDTMATVNDELYVRTQNDTKEGIPIAVLYSEMREAPIGSEAEQEKGHDYQKLISSVTLNVTKELQKTHLYSLDQDGTSISKGQQITFDQMVTVNGITYYRTQHDTKNKNDYGIPAKYLKTLYSISSMKKPRSLLTKTSLRKTSLDNLQQDGTRLGKSQVVSYNSMTVIGGERYLITNHDAKNKIAYGVPYRDLETAPTFEFSNMKIPRKLKAKKALSKTSLYTNKTDGTSIKKGQVISFSTMINIDGKLYLRTNHDTKMNLGYVIPYNDLQNL